MKQRSAAALAVTLVCALATPALAQPRAGAASSVTAGRCGGLERLQLGAVTPLLEGRLAVRGLARQVAIPRGHDIMAADAAPSTETRLFLEVNGRKIVLIAREMFRRAPTDFVAGVRADEGAAAAGSDIAAVTLPSGLRAVSIAPRVLTPAPAGNDRDAVRVLGYRVADAAGYVLAIDVYVTPNARGVGCAPLARRMLDTVTAGSRGLALAGGRTVLSSGVSIDLPSGWYSYNQPGPDFDVRRLGPITALGEPIGYLGVYTGGHPNQPALPGATNVTAPLFGAPRVWEDTTEGRMHKRTVIVTLAQPLRAHVFLGAESPALFTAVTNAAATLRYAP